MNRFAFAAKPAHSSRILEGESFRVTMLTPRLIRLETGCYTDMPTQSVWNRDLDSFTFRIRRGKRFWTIETDAATFCINVKKGKMVSVTLADGTEVRDFEAGNLLGTARTLDGISGATKLEKGIMSRSGVSVMDDSHSLLLEQDGRILPRESCRDLYFFAFGHDYLSCLRDFFRLTGQVPRIPKYALGNWWSRYRAYTQAEYQSLMEEFIRRKLPITVATIDMDWHWTDVLQRFGKDAKPGAARCKEELFFNHIAPGWTGYTWNTELFPDHRGLLNWLKENGFHITLNVHPSQGIRFFEECYPEACKLLGRDPEEKEPIAFDIADPQFVGAYMDAAHHPHEEEGVDFWWLDWQQGKTTDIPGLDPLWALNHYHTLDSGKGEKRPLILSRYAGLGSHRYPLGFSGDTHCTWESLQFQPYFTNNAANAGYTWWSHDIGGHMKGYQDDELYLRWLQYGVFSPINRLHSSNSEFMGKEPWKRSFAVKTVAEEFLRLRHRLIPHLYTANYLTHKEGLPVCMPMYYRYDCKDAYEVKNQYIFAGNLLVSPITTPADKRLNLASTEVWLPEGRWTDIFTGQIYQGGRKITMHRDLDSIPVLAPAGAIVPMYRNGDSNDLSLEQPLEIHLWRGNGNYRLYEDDGLTNAFTAGAFAVTNMTLREEGDTLCFDMAPQEGDVSILPENRRIFLRFRDITAADVFINGTSATHSGVDCVEVSMVYRNEPIKVELRNVHRKKNRPLKEAAADLMTRLQCGNAQKEIYSSNDGKMMPEFLRKAMLELKQLDYS